MKSIISTKRKRCIAVCTTRADVDSANVWVRVTMNLLHDKVNNEI